MDLMTGTGEILAHLRDGSDHSSRVVVIEITGAPDRRTNKTATSLDPSESLAIYLLPHKMKRVDAGGEKVLPMIVFYTAVFPVNRSFPVQTNSDVPFRFERPGAYK